MEKFTNAKIAVIDPELLMVWANIETKSIGCLSFQLLNAPNATIPPIQMENWTNIWKENDWKYI